jgi:hypothetical protein
MLGSRHWISPVAGGRVELARNWFLGYLPVRPAPQTTDTADTGRR